MAKLKATKRSEIGTRKVRRLRTQGLIPGIIYGHGKETTPVTLSEHDVDVVLLHGERLLEVTVGSKKENVLVKDVQYDPFGQEILHIDLARVRLDERVEVTVPILLRGTPTGAAEGGVLTQLAAEATVECLVTSIPEEIRLPVGEMQVGDARHMSDLPLPEGAKLLDDPETVVCTVSVIAEEEVPAAEEPAAEPEIVGEGEEEAGEQAPRE